MKKLYVITLCLVCFTGSVFPATSVSQWGITWTFDGDYTTGQYANGDYWVVGPVNITAITPDFTRTTEARTVFSPSRV